MRPHAHKATDDDLPDFFFSKPGEIAATVKANDTLRRIAGAHLFYPVIPTPKEQEEIEKRIEKNRRKDLQSQKSELRRIYVRGKKVEQMRVWLDALASLDPKPWVTVWEKNFLIALYAKFKKYKKVRWITHRQYESLQMCAAKYLPMPGVKECESDCTSLER